jgi:integrase
MGVYKRKGSRFYFVKFRWEGRVIRKSTRALSAKDARSIESRIKSEIARGNWGILAKKQPIPTLGEFIRKDFLPFADTQYKATKNTHSYYHYGARDLLACDFANLPLDKITSEHASYFAAKHSGLAPSTINRGLRTLQRALSLAVEWGRIEHAAKIVLAKGESERARERVLTDEEVERYLAACPQPWKDAATVMLGTGARPGEVFALRWENVALNGQGGAIRILKGKSKAARRNLRLVPRVYETIKARHEAQDSPTEGFVFPSDSKYGHFEEGAAHCQHTKALATSKVNQFPPYVLRHTALTKLAGLGADAFSLARIAGHSRVTMTQRYIHSPEDTINQCFDKMTVGLIGGTDAGHS